MQGLSRHALAEQALKIPLCHVPAGSGNGISASCGLWSSATAAHAMLRGTLAGMDAATVLQPRSGTRMLSVMCIQYGLLANLDIDTEHLRKLLGGERFTYGAVREILKWKSYKANLAWVPAENLQHALRRAEAQDATAKPECDPWCLSVCHSLAASGWPSMSMSPSSSLSVHMRSGRCAASRRFVCMVRIRRTRAGTPISLPVQRVPQGGVARGGVATRTRQRRRRQSHFS
jgi:hypothetical protein